jgi:hypothetical protein
LGGRSHISKGVWAVLLAALADVPVLMETPYATPEVDVE